VTAEEIAVMALSRAIEFSPKVPSARSVMYRRIGIRQQQLFARAGKVNPEWAGVMSNAPLGPWGGVQAVDLADLITPTEAADLITRIEIGAKGTSAYAVGQEVNPVTLADPNCADAPRVLVRNRIIMAYNRELDGVTSLNVYYSRVPLAIGPTDGDCQVELQEPHVELLVVDLTRHLLQKTIALNAAERQAAIGIFNEEEKELLGLFDQYVARFSDSTQARFGGSRYAPGAEQ
jgi:hypothetical protein